MPGWYPDPAGTANRFRYWDGRAWSHDTTGNPADPPPGGSLPAPGSGPSPRRRRLGPVIVAIVAVLVLTLTGVLVVRSLFSDRWSVDDDPAPTSTVSGWDDSSPTKAITPTPSPTPSPQAPTEEVPVQPCPEGRPTARQDHPSDGRVHGGGLSFPAVSGWRTSDGVAFSWAYDVGEQIKLVESPNWYANLAVGALFIGDGFDEPRRSAELSMQCVITSGLYPYFTDRLDVWSKAVTVDGRRGWSIRADIEVADPDLETKGDTVEVIVVDTDSPESLSMFIATVNIGDASLMETLDTTIENLQVE